MSNWTTRVAAGGIVAALGGLTALALTVQPAGSGAATPSDATPVAVTQPLTQTQLEHQTVTVTRHVRREDRRTPTSARGATVADDHGRRNGGHGADDGHDRGDDGGHHRGGDDHGGHGGDD